MKTFHLSPFYRFTALLIVLLNASHHYNKGSMPSIVDTLVFAALVYMAIFALTLKIEVNDHGLRKCSLVLPVWNETIPWEKVYGIGPGYYRSQLEYYSEKRQKRIVVPIIGFEHGLIEYVAEKSKNQSAQ